MNKTMNNKGMTIVEIIVTFAVFFIIAAAIGVTLRVSVNASSVSNQLVTTAASARNALAELNNLLASTNIESVTYVPCDSSCKGKKLSFKIPIVETADPPVFPPANSMYTSDGRVKFGAYNNGIGDVRCHYEYYVNTQNQLIKNVVCPNANCGDGQCTGGEAITCTQPGCYVCPKDCAVCGDGVCSRPFEDKSCFECHCPGDGCQVNLGENTCTCLQDCPGTCDVTQPAGTENPDW